MRDRTGINKKWSKEEEEEEAVLLTGRPKLEALLLHVLQAQLTIISLNNALQIKNVFKERPVRRTVAGPPYLALRLVAHSRQRSVGSFRSAGA